MAKLAKNQRLDKMLRQAERVKTIKSGKGAAFSCTLDRRRAGSNKQQCVIYCTLSYGKRATKFSTGVRSAWNEFDPKTEVIACRPDLTAQLRAIKHRAEQLLANLALTERMIDLEVIKAVLRGEHLVEDVTPTIVDCIDHYINQEHQRYKAGQIVERTLWKNTRWANDFRAFVILRYGPKAQLDQLKPADIKAFSLWLQNERPAPLERLCNNTAESTASHARTILNYAYDNNWVERNPFLNFRRKLDKVERETLTWDEVERFVSLELKSQSLSYARDVFSFMCLTGMNYCDVEKLTASDIQQSIKGDKYIDHRRRKTDKPSFIPLGQPALLILKKYWPGDAASPLLALPRNAPLNRNIKQIAHMAGINKTVTTKVARNTLATYLLNKGVPLPSIAALLGHSSTLTTQKYYTKIYPQTVINDMRAMEIRNEKENDKEYKSQFVNHS